jgi:uncharacterized delta-60 repeat protein
LPASLDAAGNAIDSAGNEHVAIWRFTQSGAPDTSFNTTGNVVLSGIAGSASTNGGDLGFGVAVDALGRIYVAGYSSNISIYVRGFVGRLAENGSLDTSFGTGGFVVFEPTAGSGAETLVTALALDSQGRIVVAGATSNGTYMSAAAWRLLVTGAPDGTFGTGGQFSMTGTAGGQLDMASGLAIDRSDRPVLVGYSVTAGAGTQPMAVWRLTP